MADVPVFSPFWVHAVRPPASTPERVSGQSASLSPLSESSQTALREQALSSPAVQAVLQKLRQRGWQEVQNQETSFAFEKARILVMPFAKISPQDQGDQTSPPPLTKPRSLEEIQPPPASRLPPQPKPPSEPPSLAYLMYVIAPEGEEAFAVLKESESDFLHLYPDADRRLRLLADGETLLAQLRQNERFRKFEAHLKTYVEKVACGPVVFDEANNIAYIFVQGLSSPLSTWSLAPAVYPPSSSYVPQEGCVYLLLAKVTSAATDSLTVDPQSLWLSPYAMKNGTLAGESPVMIPSSAVHLLAGGRKPSAWANSRSFAYTVLVPSPHLQPEPTVSPRHSMVLEPTAVQTLVAFVWGLADYPEDNVLYLFKTEAELTLEAYNLALKHGIPMGLGVGKDEEGPKIALINFKEISLQNVQHLYYQYALDNNFSILNHNYLTFSFRTVRKLFEKVTKSRLEDVLTALYTLAKADDEGRFDQVYKELVLNGLSGLKSLFEWHFFYSEERYRQLIRSLANSWKQYVDSQVLTTQALPLQVQQLKELFITLAGVGLEFILNTLIALIKGETVMFREVTYDGQNYIIPTFYGAKTVGTWLLNSWVQPLLQTTNIPDLPPPPAGFVNWITCLGAVIADIQGTPYGSEFQYRYGLPLIVLLANYHALLSDEPTVEELGITEVEAVRISLTFGRLFARACSSYYEFRVLGIKIGKQNWRNPDVIFARRIETKVENKVSIPIDDRVIVRYTNVLNEETLNWAKEALDKLVQREDRISVLFDANKNMYLVERARERGTGYGVDVVAIVLTEMLDVHSLYNFLNSIKESELYKKYEERAKKVRPNNPDSPYVATACVITWKNKDTGCTEYIWLDFGQEETPQNIRDDIVRAINGLTPKDPVQRSSLNGPIVTKSDGIVVQSVTGQRMDRNPIWEPPPIYPVWQR